MSATSPWFVASSCIHDPAHLYLVGSSIAAALILLFSVIVPFTKAVLVLWAVLRRDRARRARTFGFVEIIAKGGSFPANARECALTRNCY